MPTYQYRCTQCGHELEVVQKFTDDALTVCPACEGALRKLFSAVGVVFKGSGFYRTDSRSNNEKPGSESGSGDKAGKTSGDSSSTSDGASNGSGKSDSGSSKPAASSSSNGSAGNSSGKSASAKSTSAA